MFDGFWRSSAVYVSKTLSFSLSLSFSFLFSLPFLSLPHNKSITFRFWRRTFLPRSTARSLIASNFGSLIFYHFTGIKSTFLRELLTMRCCNYSLGSLKSKQRAVADVISLPNQIMPITNMYIVYFVYCIIYSVRYKLYKCAVRASVRRTCFHFNSFLGIQLPFFSNGINPQRECMRWVRFALRKIFTCNRMIIITRNALYSPVISFMEEKSSATQAHAARGGQKTQQRNDEM